ncbi:MAG TPA: DNA polymerase III subunit delta' [Alphaproteobacteria bacterium]|nr:DNA polymerase III subunit delta' [Alphaproteobacteria bacterium]
MTEGVPTPRETADLLEHKAAEATLAAAWDSGRLHHAWLLAGPPGIGKATLAYRFARHVLSGGAGLAMAPEHPVFRRVAASGHADLLTVERPVDEKTGAEKAEIPVDEVRKIPPFLHLTAGEGGWRVVIVDGAEAMSRSAANAILKVLEEPPSRALLLLVTHNPGALLPTIRSRCRRLALSPLSDRSVEALLARFRPELGEGERAALARLGEGSIGRAVDLVEGGGLGLFQGLLDLLATLPRLSEAAAHEFVEVLAKGGPRAFDTAGDLLVWWLGRFSRHLARRSLPPEILDGERGLMQRLSTLHSLDRWVELWENSRRQLAQGDAANLDRKQVMLLTLLALADA